MLETINLKVSLKNKNFNFNYKILKNRILVK